MTHDLLRNLILEMGASVERVVVTDIRDNTFFAEIEMTSNDGTRIKLDSRPSDAIALALRADCPIYVDSEVIYASRNSIVNEEENPDDEEIDEQSEEWPDVIGDAGDLSM
jgi:bifunctional DNase/RNase